jgi:hypothetical protein
MSICHSGCTQQGPWQAALLHVMTVCHKDMLPGVSVQCCRTLNNSITARCAVHTCLLWDLVLLESVTLIIGTCSRPGM